MQDRRFEADPEPRSTPHLVAPMAPIAPSARSPRALIQPVGAIPREHKWRWPIKRRMAMAAASHGPRAPLASAAPQIPSVITSLRNGQGQVAGLRKSWRPMIHGPQRHKLSTWDLVARLYCSRTGSGVQVPPPGCMLGAVHDLLSQLPAQAARTCDNS